MYPLVGGEQANEVTGTGDPASASGVVTAGVVTVGVVTVGVVTTGTGEVGSVATSDEQAGVVAKVSCMVTGSALERLVVRGRGAVSCGDAGQASGGGDCRAEDESVG